MCIVIPCVSRLSASPRGNHESRDQCRHERGCRDETGAARIPAHDIYEAETQLLVYICNIYLYIYVHTYIHTYTYAPKCTYTDSSQSVCVHSYDRRFGMQSNG